MAGPHPHALANAAVLVGLYGVIARGLSGPAAYAPLSPLEPFTPFRDASTGPSTYHLRVPDVLAGFARARAVGIIDNWTSPASTFDVVEYDHYEAVENGDLNWIVPGRFLAFSGPSPTPRMTYGYRAHVPEDYHAYFVARGVAGVVRLNRPLYEGARFEAGGFEMHELYFPDGSTPPPHLLRRFLSIAETAPGALAIHCKAGLGRTGVLICAWLIKHAGFTAAEAIGYIRVVRPGSVLGLQQNWLASHEAGLVAEGVAHRAAKAAAASAATPARVVSVSADARAARAAAPHAPLAATASPSTPPPAVGPAPATASTPPSTTSSRLTNFLGRLAGKGVAVAATTPEAAASASPAVVASPPSGGTARMVAPNGQPRKVPAALLAAGPAAMAAYGADEEPAVATGPWTIGA